MADRLPGAAPLRPQARPTDPDTEGTRPRARPDDLLPETPEQVAEDATQSRALPLDETALIGLFHGPDGGSALLRLADGRILRVSAGAEVEDGRVTAIGRDVVRLRQGDRELILRMPA
jgi:hypothetical protein